jgi:AraC-like DNA-binding protein
MASSSELLSHINFAIPADCVSTLYAGRLGLFQMVHCSGREDTPRIAGSTRGYHILVPLAGAFVWNRDVGSPVFANSNSIIHVGSNDSYTVTHPVGEELSAAFWPRRAILDELVGTVGDRMPVSAPCSGETQMELRKLISALRNGADDLEFEELAIAWLKKIHAPIDRDRTVSTKSIQAVGRAKEYLHARFEEKLSLSQIADAVGVSPVYLTQLFKASEGVPLYRYHLSLRLNAALDRLPKCDNITALALDLGFSSHSHFSSEFGRRFGITPTDHRGMMRSAVADDPKCSPRIQAVPLCTARGGGPDLGAAWWFGKSSDSSPP